MPSSLFMLDGWSLSLCCKTLHSEHLPLCLCCWWGDHALTHYVASESLFEDPCLCGGRCVCLDIDYCLIWIDHSPDCSRRKRRAVREHDRSLPISLFGEVYSVSPKLLSDCIALCLRHLHKAKWHVFLWCYIAAGSVLRVSCHVAAVVVLHLDEWNTGPGCRYRPS